MHLYVPSNVHDRKYKMVNTFVLNIFMFLYVTSCNLVETSAASHIGVDLTKAPGIFYMFVPIRQPTWRP